MKYFLLIVYFTIIIFAKSDTKCKPIELLLFNNYTIYLNAFEKDNMCLPNDNNSMIVNNKTKKKIMLDSRILSIQQIKLNERNIIIMIGHFGNHGHTFYLFTKSHNGDLNLVKNGKIGSSSPIAFAISNDSIYIFDKDSVNYGKKIYLTIYRYDSKQNIVNKIIDQMKVAEYVEENN